MAKDCIDRGEEERISGKTNQRRIVRCFGFVRVDMLLEQVARNLGVRPAVIRPVVGPTVRDHDAEGCRSDQDSKKDPPLLSNLQH